MPASQAWRAFTQHNLFMELQDLINRVTSITTDESKTIDDRIDEVFELRQQAESDNKQQNLENDLIFFDAMVKMVEQDNATHLHDHDLLQLYTLLAETYTDLDRYKPLGDLANDVLSLLRDNCTSWEAMAETMPRILDAVGESVYSHSLYELHMMYIKKALEEGRFDEEIKGRVRKTLKLRMLLEDGFRYDFRFFTPELNQAISGLFSPEEMLKIMLNPHIGHLRKDPVEYTWKWERIYYDMEKRLDERFANAPRQMGFCFLYWSAKMDLLREEYGIEWHSPAQMNPNVIFD